MKNHTQLAMFLATSGHSGVDRVMTNLIDEFADRGITVDVLKIANHGPYLERIPTGVRTIDLGVSHVNSSIVPLIRYLKHERPQALLTDKDRVNRIALLARRMSQVPTRIAVRIGTTVSKNLARRSWFERRLQYFSMKHLYPQADCIILPSQGAAQDFVELTGIPMKKIKVIPSPVASDKLMQMAAEPVDHPWCLSEGPPIILGIGELCARKDFTTLIRAFSKVRKQRACRLMILGKGRKRNKLLKLIRELRIADDVSLPGFVKNPYAYMRKAAVFVLSSNCEGAPVVLMEALAAGLPAVSTDCPSGPAEILQNGRIGPLVPISDADALAGAIMAILDSPPDKALLISAARPYSVSASASQYLAVLRLDNRNDKRWVS